MKLMDSASKIRSLTSSNAVQNYLLTNTYIWHTEDIGLKYRNFAGGYRVR